MAQSIRVGPGNSALSIKLDGQQTRAGRAPYLKKRNEIAIGISPDLLNAHRYGFPFGIADVAFRELPHAKAEILLAPSKGMLCWRV
jgi:hypothetical protein